MQSLQFRYELAVIAIFCIVSLFLFPISAGPYCAVHGPLTEIRALDGTGTLFWAMALAALSLLAMVVQITWRAIGTPFALVVRLAGAPGRIPLLRC